MALDPTLYIPSVNIDRGYTQHFRFQVNGTSDPDNIIPVAATAGVATIDYTAVGVYSIVLTRALGQLVTVHCSTLGNAAASNEKVHTVSWTASTNTLLLQSVLNDTATVLDDNTWVCVTIHWARFAADAASGASVGIS